MPVILIDWFKKLQSLCFIRLIIKTSLRLIEDSLLKYREGFFFCASVFHLVFEFASKVVWNLEFFLQGIECLPFRKFNAAVRKCFFEGVFVLLNVVL